MDDPGALLLQFLIIIVLTMINAFFASAEMAVVSLNKTKIRMLSQDGNKKAQQVEKLIAEPSKFLSTIQVGITLAGFFSSAAAATGLSDDLGRALASVGIPYGQQISLVLVTIILSYFTLVFGELYPKRIALQSAEKIAMKSAGIILFLMKAVSPFVKLLSMSTSLVLRITNKNVDDLEEKISKEELKSMVEVGQEQGVFNQTETNMINSIFTFDDKTANEVMTPRTKVYMINQDQPITEYLDELLSEKYSRIPVFEEDIDNIVGVLYMKDLMLEARRVGFENIDVKHLMHPAYFQPERKNIDELFLEMQASHKHMAILIDEYGGFAGIVTMEDLIEEIVGNIDDEFDEEDPDIRALDSTTYLVKGLVPIHELNSRLHLDLDEDSEDYDTLGGLIIDLLGHIPKPNEKSTIEYRDLIFKIESVEEMRVEKVKIVKAPQPTQREEEP